MALLDKFKKTYSLNVKCSNCGGISIMKIPKGLRIDEYKKDAICDTCGCSELASISESKATAERLAKQANELETKAKELKKKEKTEKWL